MWAAFIILLAIAFPVGGMLIGIWQRNKANRRNAESWAEIYDLQGELNRIARMRHPE